jgi:acetylglutamate kinase
MITIVKIGGNIVDDEAALARFATDFAAMEGPKVLVHGGGVMASELQRTLGIEPRMTAGRRITDRETLRIVAMVYAGWINKDVVARLQAAGCDALGLSGADGGSVLAVRRPPLPIDYGWVGDVVPEGVNTRFLESLLTAGTVPVFCAITHDGHGQLLNTNADTMASTIARAFAARHDVRLLYCFEKRGVLSDPDDDGSALATLSREDYDAMKASGTARAGMLAKLDNAFAALAGGVSEVVVMHAADLSKSGAGTRLTL